jgi:hypothetical protein
MGESDRTTNTYIGLGPAGSPERDGALPKFISDTQGWISRIQPIADGHPGVNPFLHRSLQRFIDDQKLLAVNIAPGPLKSYDEAIWADSLASYGGPLSVCDQLGVKW